MRTLTFCLLGVLVILLAACAVSAPPTPAPTTAPTVALKSGTMRFSLQGNPGVKDVPWMMAVDLLHAEGYATEFTPFGDSSLIPAALDRGNIEVGSANANTMWSATAKGANLRIIGSRISLDYYLISKSEIKTCGDLQNARVGNGSLGGTTKILLDQYITRNCRGISLQTVVIGETKNRLAALMAGELDAAPLEIEDWIEIQKQAPSKFHILFEFAKEFPAVQFSTFAVQHDWAVQHPEMVKDFLRALLVANRQVYADPESLVKGMVRYLSFDENTARGVAQAYIAAGIWDVNGGLAADKIQSTLDFYGANGIVPVGLHVQDVADLSYLNAVLDEIGRK